MQTVIKVRYGKPILKLKYRTLRGIQICSTVFCAVIFLYSFNLFTVAIKLKRKVSVFIDLISGNGILFPGYISLAGVTCIFANIFVVYYMTKAFSGSKNKYINSMLFMIVMVCLINIFILYLVCICILHHSYSSRVEVHDGIISAMTNYSKDSLTKGYVDMLQVENACCGSKNYTDWYSIKWYDANLINTETYSALKGETPFSCCSVQSVYPCIHHGIEVPVAAYIYNKDANISISLEGCHSKILKLKQTTGWILVLRIVLLILLQSIVCIGMRLIQTAHMERKSFDREDKLYTSWIIGCYAGKSRQAVAPPVPPLPPELQD